MKKKKLIIGSAMMVGTAGVVGLGGLTIHADDIQQIAASAVPVANEYGLYPSVMIAQAILESDGGTSQLASQYNNYFGVKYISGEGVDLPTNEYIDGEPQTIVQKFQVYDSVSDSFISQANLLRSDYYSGTWRENTNSYLDATAYLQGRYATDPNYANLLNGIISEYDLTAYDDGSYTTPAATSENGGYVVQVGDTLSSIAQAYGVSVDQLASENGIANTDQISIGQVLTIPGATAGNSGAPSSTGTYTVQENDSLWSIAQANGTTAANLAAINGISTDSVLQIGQQLSLSGESGSVASGTTYTVKSGDTLSAIAAEYGTTADQIAAENGLANADTLAIGETLNIG